MNIIEVMQDKNVGKKYEFQTDCFIVRKSVGRFFLEEVETGKSIESMYTLHTILFKPFKEIKWIWRVNYEYHRSYKKRKCRKEIWNL